MKRIVVDSTVCVNWFIQARGKRDRGFALELLEKVRAKQVRVVQPTLWRAHVAAMLLRKRGVDARKTVEGLLAVDAKDQNGPDVLRLATELATRFHADMFDTLYHAVAIDSGIELITANADYLNRLGHVGHVRLLGDWVARSRVAERQKHYRQQRAGVPATRHKKR